MILIGAIDPQFYGASIAIIGSTISILGACYNNLVHEHKRAMQCWMLSNILLLVWSIGFTIGVWNGGLSGVALIGMYSVFTATNMYGLVLYHVR